MRILPNAVLTLYPTFNNPQKETFWKHYGKRRKCWYPAFSPFSTMFSTLSKTDTIIWATFILSSAITFSLVWSKILSFGKELGYQFYKKLYWKDLPFTTLMTFFWPHVTKFWTCLRLPGRTNILTMFREHQAENVAFRVPSRLFYDLILWTSF